MISPYVKFNAILLGIAAVCVGACEPGEESKMALPPSTIAETPGVERAGYSLPHELRLDNDSANEFVELAMNAVSAGDYDPFRLLWSVKDEPVSRDDFEQRWTGLTQVRVRKLRPIILKNADGVPTGDETYAILVDFSSDPAVVSRRREPLRDIVWLVVNEQGQWRLAKPPKKVKLWLRKEIGDTP